jgi:dTDP-4-amino-4,6-dideoxygalactose transaminase
MALLKNFGHTSAETFGDIGINGKNSEFHAAMGLCNLKYIDKIIEARKQQHEIYDHWLGHSNLIKPETNTNTEYNFSYYPVLFDTEELLLKTQKNLNDHWIYPRRYFFPSLSTLPYIKTEKDLPFSMSICSRVLCLPMFFELSEVEQEMIVRVILRTLKF